MSCDPRQPQTIFLNPAELVIAEEPTVVTTILGSCISVILYSPKLRVGGICHAVLPVGGVEGKLSKYVDQSLGYMFNYFRRCKQEPKDLVAKLFGGAEMFGPHDRPGSENSIGGKNVRMALEILRDAGLEPASSDVGGRLGRKLLFYTHTGQVFLKRVKRGTERF